MPNKQDERDRRREEALKLCFDGCKHMALISTAVATIFVTFYQEEAIGSILLAVALSTLGLSILTSLIGMLLPISRVATGGGGRLAILLLVASIGLFVTGVVTAVPPTVNIPVWVIGVLLGISGGVIGLTVGPMVRTPQEEEKDPE